jgi:opacity protein-like surface antigen
MKRLMCCMVVAATVMLAPVPARSQVQFALGLKAGLNLSSVSVDPDPYSGLQQQGITSTKSGGTGLAVAAVAELNFGKMFAVALEPGYTQKSTKWELTQGQAKATDERTVSYLQIPVLFRVKFLEGQVRPYGFAGPNICFVLSSKAKFQGFANIQDGEYDVKSTTSSTDFGLEFGGGAEFKVAKQVALTGDVRFNLGLSNLDNSPAQAGQTSSAKSRSFLIQLGALFFL